MKDLSTPLVNIYGDTPNTGNASSSTGPASGLTPVTKDRSGMTNIPAWARSSNSPLNPGTTTGRPTPMYSEMPSIYDLSKTKMEKTKDQMIQQMVTRKPNEQGTPSSAVLPDMYQGRNISNDEMHKKAAQNTLDVQLKLKLKRDAVKAEANVRQELSYSLKQQ